MAKGKKTGGRVSGSVNRLTKTFKELVSLTVEKLNNDPKTSLYQFAKENPAEFWKIAAKLIPTEISGENGGAIKIKIIDEGDNDRAS